MSESGTITNGIRMVQLCPGCRQIVDGGQHVTRDHPSDPWWHTDCYGKPRTV